MKPSGTPDALLSLTNHEIYAITATHQGRKNGMIATWIMPATLVPGTPRIVAVFSPQNYTTELLRGARRFVAQMLAEGQEAIVPALGLTSGRDRDKLAGIALEPDLAGAPILRGTCGWMDCRIVSETDSGDRIVFLADVVNQKVFRERKPLRMAGLATLPPATVDALVQKKLRDGERDRALIKEFEKHS